MEKTSAKRVRSRRPSSPPRILRSLTLSLVEGVEGPSVYLNAHRIAGPKPWGGGQVAREWKVSSEDVYSALERDAAPAKPTRQR